MSQLAIVIPYYKITYFEKTLKSLANQTNKDFTVYIGNDCSPEDPIHLIKAYNDRINCIYKAYETNIGGQSLVKQWERCINDLVKEEKWVMILGDDDCLGENVVEEFYTYIKEAREVDLIRFSTCIIDQQDKIISQHFTHEKVENKYDFLLKKLSGETRSSLGEYIFLAQSYNEKKFINFPMAWHSDDYAWITFPKKNIHSINQATVYIRESEDSISGSDKYDQLKKKAVYLFFTSLLKKHKNQMTPYQSKAFRDYFEKNNNINFFQVISFYLKNYSISHSFLYIAKFCYKKIISRLNVNHNTIKNIKYSILDFKDLIKNYFITKYLKKYDNTIKCQINNPLSIPVFIISYNQLEYLQKLIDFLIKRNFENIIILDNNSSYPPLLNYFDELSTHKNITINRYKENYGHLVFWKRTDLYEKYKNQFFILTDADINPNENIPDDFLQLFITLLLKYPKYNKVGFSLDIDDIPDENNNKQKIINFEKKYWKKQKHNHFEANIDTTFALYRPFSNTTMLALRTSKPYTAKHGGWYINSSKLNEEQLFYYKTANDSSSWKTDENGKLAHPFYKKHYKNE